MTTVFDTYTITDNTFIVKARWDSYPYVYHFPTENIASDGCTFSWTGFTNFWFNYNNPGGKASTYPRIVRNEEGGSRQVKLLDKKYRIGGYVKRAKLNLRNEKDIRAFHRQIYETRFGGFEDGELVDVFIDITGYKETSKRPEMLRLMRDCADGKINLIFAETKGYLAANTREFCYWLNFIFNLNDRVDIITDDDQFNINTITNADSQREALIKMAEDYIYLNPPDHQKWLAGVIASIALLDDA